MNGPGNGTYEARTQTSEVVGFSASTTDSKSQFAHKETKSSYASTSHLVTQDTVTDGGT